MAIKVEDKNEVEVVREERIGDETAVDSAIVPGGVSRVVALDAVLFPPYRCFNTGGCRMGWISRPGPCASRSRLPLQCWCHSSFTPSIFVITGELPGNSNSNTSSLNFLYVAQLHDKSSLKLRPHHSTEKQDSR